MKHYQGGSVMVMDFENRELFDEYLNTEPYYTERVWEDVTVEPMNVAILNDERVGK